MAMGGQVHRAQGGKDTINLPHDLQQHRHSPGIRPATTSLIFTNFLFIQELGVEALKPAIPPVVGGSGEALKFSDTLL